MNSWNLEIECPKSIRLPQDWGHLFRLILATFPMEEIKEKLLTSWNKKSGQKYLRKSLNRKTWQHKEGDNSIQKHSYIDANHESTRSGNHPNILPLFQRFRRSLTSYLSSLRHEAHQHLAKWRPKSKGVGEGCLPQQPYGSIYSENQKTKMPLWAKRKITTNEG
jgi:hypothetical protein